MGLSIDVLLYSSSLNEGYTERSDTDRKNLSWVNQHLKAHGSQIGTYVSKTELYRFGENEINKISGEIT